MITFESRHPNIKSADLLMRKAHTLYPHSSTTQLGRRMKEAYPWMQSGQRVPAFLKNINNKIMNLRDKRKGFGIDFIMSIISSLKYARAGNCFEEAALTRILGQINGQDNINVGSIVIKHAKDNNPIPIDHAIAFITNKEIKHNSIRYFEGKEALIIDPWLGITDWAGNYFTKIKNEYKQNLTLMPNCKNSKFGILRFRKHFDENIDKDFLKDMYPELILKNYKPIKLD